MDSKKVRGLIAALLSAGLALAVALNQQGVVDISDTLLEVGGGAIAFLIGLVLKSPIESKPLPVVEAPKA